MEINANIHLIKLFASSDILREYSVFLNLKNKYINGCIYGYNAHKLSKSTGLSRTTLNKYIPFFLKNGWAKIHNGNLCFISNVNLAKLYNVAFTYVDKNKKDYTCTGKPIKIKKSNNIQQTLNDLRFSLIKEKNTQFTKILHKSNDLTKPTGPYSLTILKSAKRFFKKNKANVIIDENLKGYRTTYKNLANIINLSKSSAVNLMKTKVKECKLKIIKSKPKFISKSNTNLLKYLQQNQFSFKGSIYTAQPNQYMFF